MHLEEHPSPFSTFPSSHVYPLSMIAFRQVDLIQVPFDMKLSEGQTQIVPLYSNDYLQVEQLPFETELILRKGHRTQKSLIAV
jgi:hypothetical protein